LNINYTLVQYTQNAEALSARYESTDVSILQKQLLDCLHKCCDVLELGCGSGRDAAFLINNSSFRAFTATDGSDAMLTRASRIHPELDKHLMLLQLPSDLTSLKCCYDGIYSIATLMHLTESDIADTLNWISRVLSPGGVLFISVCTTREKQPANDPRLFTLKDRPWWLQQIEDCGLKVKNAADSADGLHRTETIWLNITAVKQI